jgi:hypothetical protein
MYKKTVTLCALVALMPTLSFAQAPGDENARFQQMFTVPAQDILVPTVVAVPLPDLAGSRTQFLVVAAAANSYVASAFQREFATEPVSIIIKVNGTPRASLVDNNQETNETFPVPETGTGLVEFFVQGTEALLASSFVIDLAQNVSLPVSIQVKADVGGGEQIVLAAARPRGTQVRFPQVTATNWYIAMEYIQPLRINELRFVQDDIQTDQYNSLRFLAQPETEYQVYLDPELYVAITTPEAGNLTTDQDVLVLEETAVLRANPTFTYADSDSDTIADQFDNCVSLPNPEQIDINQNGRGDVCDDYDKDGVINAVDNCQDTPNRNQADEDGDKIGDVCDEEESRVTEKYAWIPWAAMGGAILVFGSLFWIMLRRMRSEQASGKEKEPVKKPMSDRTNP